jgi:hypothetical protein
LRVLAAAAIVAATALPAARAEDAAVVTETWREPDVPVELHWHLLAIPEYVVELALSPLAVVVANVERYRLDLRLYDLLRNDAGTLQFVPALKLSFGDGLGVGGTLHWKQVLGEEERVRVGGLWRLNRDYEAGVRYTHAIAAAEGRELDVRVGYEVDRNLPYYGLGGDSAAVEHVLREDVATASAAFDLVGRGAPDVQGIVELGVRRSEMTNGDEPGTPGVGDADATVAPPPEYGRTLAFPWLRALLRLDRRDAVGRPSRGWLVELEAKATRATADGSLSSVGGRAEAMLFLPVLPERRVVRLHAGLAGAAAASRDDDIPLHELVVLGRGRNLAGYARGRFRDRLGWWSGAEYRFPIWELLDRGVSASPTLFVQAGRVARDGGELVDGPVRWSAGAGLRAAHDSFELLDVQLGFSPEGFELHLHVGAEL